MADAPSHEELRDVDFAAALAARREDAADTLAGELLTRDTDGYVFVDVTADAARAVFHQPHEWAVRSAAPPTASSGGCWSRTFW